MYDTAIAPKNFGANDYDEGVMKMTVMINGYVVELRGFGANAVWCVYAKRTPKRNAGSNLVLQISTSKYNGVPLILSKGQQVKKLASIIAKCL